MTERASQTIVIDFRADWAKLMQQYLARIGARASDLSEPWDLTAAVLNAERLHLPRKPRRVLRANGLGTSDRVQAFLGAAEAGEDLEPFQSRGYDPTFNDRLLNDLGVRHFHMTPPSVRRVDELLFAMVTDDAFYAIAVLSHATFDSENLIEVVHANWPDLLVPFIAPGVIPGSYEGPSPTERGAFRKLGITTAIQVSDGTVYLPPGGSLVSGGVGGRRGLSFDVVRDANDAMNFISDLQRAAEKDGGRLAAMIPHVNKSLVLAYRDGMLFGWSKAADLAIRLAPSPVRLRLGVAEWLAPD